MNTSNVGLAHLVFTAGLLVFSISNAFAVANVEVSVAGQQDESIPSDSVSLFNEQNQEVEQDDFEEEDEEDDDDKGAVWYWNDLEEGTYTLRSGGEVVRTFTISPGDEVKQIRVRRSELAALDTGEQMDAVDGSGFPGRLGPVEYAIGVRGLIKYGAFDGDLNSSFGNPSGQFDLSGYGGGLDLMVQPLCWNRLFFKTGFAGFGGADDRTAEGNLHPTAGDDSYLELEESHYFRFLMGYTFCRKEPFQVDLLGGLQATDSELTLVTDESGGGGVRETFTEDEYRFGPILGLQARHQLRSVENVSLYGGVSVTYMEDMNVSGTSGSGFDYDGEVDSGFQGDATFGLMFGF